VTKFSRACNFFLRDRLKNKPETIFCAANEGFHGRKIFKIFVAYLLCSAKFPRSIKPALADKLLIL